MAAADGGATANLSVTVRDLGFRVDDGPAQLALSEAILDAVGAGLSPATLRVYSWSEPVVILGVGQPASDLDLDACRRLGYRILRRIGGGTAVYHDQDEVSVDLIVPAGHRLASSDVHRGYERFSNLLRGALDQLGVSAVAVGVEEARDEQPEALLRPICFGSISPFELRGGGRKLAGLCQIRRRGAVAYQAALHRTLDGERLIAALIHDDDEVRRARSARLHETVTDLDSLAGAPVEFPELARALVAAAVDLGLDVQPGELTDREIAQSRRIATEKYANPAWTFRR
jgi:lipoate-protein ligase A